MNDLQRLFKARQISMRDLADQIDQDMHSVQKTVKGTRQTPHIQKAVAGFLGLAVDECFGSRSAFPLRQLVAIEIKKRRSEYENKLKAKLFDSHRISGMKKVVNG